MLCAGQSIYPLAWLYSVTACCCLIISALKHWSCPCIAWLAWAVFNMLYNSSFSLKYFYLCRCTAQTSWPVIYHHYSTDFTQTNHLTVSPLTKSGQFLDINAEANQVHSCRWWCNFSANDVSFQLFAPVHCLHFYPLHFSLAVPGRLWGWQLAEVPSGHRAQYRGGAGPLEHRHCPWWQGGKGRPCPLLHRQQLLLHWRGKDTGNENNFTDDLQI